MQEHSLQESVLSQIKWETTIFTLFTRLMENAEKEITFFKRSNILYIKRSIFYKNIFLKSEHVKHQIFAQDFE